MISVGHFVDPPQFFSFYHLPAAWSPTTLVKYTRVSNKQIKPLLDFIESFPSWQPVPPYPATSI